LTIARTQITGLNPVAEDPVITLSIIITVARIGCFITEKRQAGVSFKSLHTPEVTKAHLLAVAEDPVITVQV
jgi:hypothetical protein